MSQQLWSKGDALDAVIARFTVGEDPVLDLAWAWHDVVASAAHVRTQFQAGMLNQDEAQQLLGGLATVLAEVEAAKFVIPPEQEDVHTAVELRLQTLLGPVAGRLHTGRSRNDQVLTDLRLWLKEQVIGAQAETQQLIGQFLAFAGQHGAAPLPGYTHLQRAMPSSWALWAAGFAGALAGVLPLLDGALRVVDRCPLGSAAGYGTPLPLDRHFSASLLGFSGPEEAVTSSQLLRGLDAAAVLGALGAIATLIARFAADVVLYTSVEFNLLKLPDAFTTGSSIMPQKRNPDVAELLRAQARKVLAARREIEDIVAGLSSGYHRDLQLSKAPMLRGILAARESLCVATHLVPALQPQPLRMDPELYATAEAFRRAQQEGRPFRETYREVGIEVKAGVFVPAERPAAPMPDLEGIRREIRQREDVRVLRQTWRALVDKPLLMSR